MNYFPDHSRVWIYQASRELSSEEVILTEATLQKFVDSWAAHGQPLKAAGQVCYNRFIVLMVNEDQEAPSGCSIDNSVSVIKELGKVLAIDFFDRWNIAYRQKDLLVSCTREEFEEGIRSGKITSETIVFNNLVNTKKEWETNWEIPLKQSWHARIFQISSFSH